MDGAEKITERILQEADAAAAAIQHHSTLLARTLEILTQEGTRRELGPGFELLERTIGALDASANPARDLADATVV